MDAMMAMGMTAKMVVMGKTVTVVLMEVLRFWSIFGIQVARKTWQTNRLLPTIVTDALLGHTCMWCCRSGEGIS